MTLTRREFLDTAKAALVAVPAVVVSQGARAGTLQWPGRKGDEVLAGHEEVPVFRSVPDADCPFRFDRIMSQPTDYGRSCGIGIAFKTPDGEQWRQGIHLFGATTPHRTAQALRQLADNIEWFGTEGYKELFSL
jgi:hypothetical protein